MKLRHYLSLALFCHVVLSIIEFGSTRLFEMRSRRGGKAEAVVQALLELTVENV